MFYFKVKPSGGPDVYYQLLKKYTTSKEYMDTKEAFQNSVAPLRKNKVILFIKFLPSVLIIAASTPSNEVPLIVPNA